MLDAMTDRRPLNFWTLIAVVLTLAVMGPACLRLRRATLPSCSPS